MSAGARLPRTFLRGLEADLRALCADARRRNPDVKEAAERVILVLKEAHDAESEAAAADEAASTFCTACETIDPNAGGSALSLQVKIAVRAVSCLHKLLTHRVLSPPRLPEVLDALERLSSPPVDDNLTVKVLQGLLSLLTVRSYAKSLSEEDLSRAFSLLFTLRSSRSGGAGNAALSAISPTSSSSDGGVIEQTSQAAFRQASSDLFALAAHSAVMTAVEMQAASGSTIPLSDFQNETRAAYSLFVDLCNAVTKEKLVWLRLNRSEPTAKTSTSLDLALALEVMDDCLASNIVLFAGQSIFCDLLSGRLCPAVHKLMRTVNDKATLKSLLGLVVTLTENYWRRLTPDSEALLYALTQMCRAGEMGEASPISWRAVYAIEALRCIFKSKPNASSPIIDFVKAFDLGSGSGQLMTGVVTSVCDVLSLASKIDAKTLPPTPISGSLKPFANTISNSVQFVVAIATGLYVEIVQAASDSMEEGRGVAESVLLREDTTGRALSSIGKLVAASHHYKERDHSHSGAQASMDALQTLATTLGQVAMIATTCGMTSIRDKAMKEIGIACQVVANARSRHSDAASWFGQRTLILFKALLAVHAKCRESLGRSWLSVIEALEKLDELIHHIRATNDVDDGSAMSSVLSLEPALDMVFTSTTTMEWGACHDMISALVQCSRQTVSGFARNSVSEDQVKLLYDSHPRVFGIARAETAILFAFKRQKTDSDVLPGKLWQLMTAHLISVCTDSPLQPLRTVALNSLTRIACEAIPSGDPPFVSHSKIITPFLDLFSSSHIDVRAGALSAVYTVLETQGERLTGEFAWGAVLRVLSTAAGPTEINSSRASDSIEFLSRNARPASQDSGASVTPTGDMMSEAFKTVQLIADDFLTSLVEGAFPLWMEVLELYSRQDDDVNVALTSIGLLWRTADYFAKNTGLENESGLWVRLFEVLKDISMDERPEIRNCAVKTLTGALSAHSFQLSARAWNGCAERALLPLLEEVMQGGASSGQTDDGHLMVKSRRDVPVLLHHSRDTPRKQWNETRVLALAGVARVLRTAMPRLAVLQDESGRPLFLVLTDGGTNGLWRKMLRAAGVAASSRDREVAVAGVSALLELLNAAGFVLADNDRSEGASLDTRPGLSKSAPAVLSSERKDGESSLSWVSGMMGSGEAREDEGSLEVNNTRLPVERDSADSTVMLWEAVWSALREVIGGKEVSTNKLEGQEELPKARIVDSHALQLLAEGLLLARVTLARKFTPESSQMLVDVLMQLLLGQGVSLTEESDALELSDVQVTVLSGLQALDFGGDQQSWIALVEGLLRIVQEQGCSAKPTTLARRSLGIIGDLYSRNELPMEVQKLELSSVLRVVGKIMLLRNQDEALGRNKVSYTGAYGVGATTDTGAEEAVPLWVEATEVVMKAMDGGARGGNDKQREEVWREFVLIMEAFLYSPQRVQREAEYRRNVAESERAESYDIRLSECVEEVLTHIDSSTSQATKQRLVELLSRGAEEGKASGRPRFVRSCQKRLFQLADAVWAGDAGVKSREHRSISKESNKCVVETCSRVLGQFITDGQRAGRCPLPAARRAEAVFLLQQLRRLNSFDAKEGDTFSKTHLVTLYPRLCECVDSRDEAVRHLARELLDEAALGGRERGHGGTGGLEMRV